MNIEGVNLSLLQNEDNFKTNRNVRSNLIWGINDSENYKLSFFIPTFCRAKTITETIESILNQDTEVHFKIVIVDNNPERNDETEIALSAYQNNPYICYYKNEINIGMVGNWNRGYELIKSEWVSMVHDDDLISDDYVKMIQPLLTKDKDAVFCKSQYFSDEIIPIDKNEPMVVRKVLLRELAGGNIFFIIGNVMRRSCVIDLGGFNITANVCADYLFFSKMTLHKSVYMISKTLTYYRVAINEGLKISAMDKMMFYDHTIRKQIMQYLGVPNFVINIDQIYLNSVREKIRQTFNKEYIFAEFHTENKLLLFVSRVFWKLTRIYLSKCK